MNARFIRVRAFAAALALGIAAMAQQPQGGGKLPPPPPVPAGVTAHRDLAYIAGGHERQKLDLFVPGSPATPRPVIVWVHGGGWSGGDKSGCPPLRQGWTQRGYAIASLNYRLSQHAVFPAQIEDCKAAIRWLRAHAGEYRLDPERFGAWGSSAGGHLVALLGTSGGVAEFDVGGNLAMSSRVQAVMDDFGPTDFRQMDAHRIPGATLVHNSPQSPESRLVGADIGDPANAARVARANPITYVSTDDAPFLILHGDQDALVPHHQSELLYEALRASRVKVRLNIVRGGGHGAGFGEAELEIMRREFFDHHLLGIATNAARWPMSHRSSTTAASTAGAKAAKK
jgi:acetyl esterase/lipase